MASFVGLGTVGRGRLQYGADARAWAQARSADIAVTVCGGFPLNSGRRQHTMSAVRLEQCECGPAGGEGRGDIRAPSAQYGTTGPSVSVPWVCVFDISAQFAWKLHSQRCYQRVKSRISHHRALSLVVRRQQTMISLAVSVSWCKESENNKSTAVNLMPSEQSFDRSLQKKLKKTSFQANWSMIYEKQSWQNGNIRKENTTTCSGDNYFFLQ